ncbi:MULTISPECIES: uroporphyrinogen-III C-methyltransferase [unclassified Shewanella]|uniref:uroporphyrinogen-III C-methyltransferase n=1 Tax=unclassified Shewanella TaxID=196818 RepID=UPI001BB8D45E|nr:MULTISPECIES: uroporphyrinogen-III C-methyltransferase [unclassified Shewanella]GIU07901.1 uroporphyrin-III C-methyltransferase [Shewanella sp. MBTL60-112-B1]GIU30569.1 uroporphyrin-III C-methyltransferase [Shewanella sp. MBTL60-112-B2]
MQKKQLVSEKVKTAVNTLRVCRNIAQFNDCSLSQLRRDRTVNAPDKEQYLTVKIVGAGCGDIDLLTIKAAQAIMDADEVVYDNLVSQDILSLVSDSCGLHYMGKRCNQKSSSQTDINNKLYQLALMGSKVVRLKGGDPNVFGRGSEEALFLAKHGVKSEFIAGITAALGCASSAAIPLTHRAVARSVTFVTGRTCDDSAQHWRHLLAAQSTLVFYMGKEKAAEIASHLLKAGVKPNVPVAFISDGARLEQSVCYCRISEMQRAAEKMVHKGPTLIIIGDVVNVSRELADAFCEIKHSTAKCPAIQHSAKPADPAVCAYV